MTPLLVALCVVLLDQASKEWVRGAFSLHESVPVIPGFFHLTYIRNTGAAWGMFSGQNIALSALALVMLAVLVVFRRKILPPGRVHRVALGLLCARAGQPIRLSRPGLSDWLYTGDLADAVGSTSQLIAAAQNLPNKTFIVATDRGIFYKMQQAAPGKKLIAAPTLNRGTCNVCAHCPWMAMNGLQNLLDALEHPAGHEIEVDASIIERARLPIDRMLALSRELGIVAGKPKD